jgi:hypothetical protein
MFDAVRAARQQVHDAARDGNCTDSEVLNAGVSMLAIYILVVLHAISRSCC